MPRVKSLPKRAKTVTRVYDPETGNRVKITQIDPTKKYSIRFKSGTVQTRQLSKAFLKPRARQSRYKNLRVVFTPEEIGLTERAIGFDQKSLLISEIKKGFAFDLPSSPFLIKILESHPASTAFLSKVEELHERFGLHIIYNEFFVEYTISETEGDFVLHRSFAIGTDARDYMVRLTKFVMYDSINKAVNFSGKNKLRLKGDAKYIRLAVNSIEKVKR